MSAQHTPDFLDEREFYELCYAYRCTSMTNQKQVIRNFEAIKDHVRKEIASAPLLKEEVERLRKALIAITSNPYVSLGDLVYQVRDCEGKGWEGEAVKQWSDACVEIKKLTESLNP